MRFLPFRSALSPVALPWILMLLAAVGLSAVFHTGASVAEPSPQATDLATAAAQKTGVLLVSHGSRSVSWRKMLLEFGDKVEPRLMELPGVRGVKSAFMEYNEPSIATRLKEFDREGFDRVILIPILLTVSTHSFDDIPTIIGLKQDAGSLAAMKQERIEQYTPKAKVAMAPLLDFSELLVANLPRRVKALSKTPAQEGVVLVAYGDATYNDEWTAFFKKMEEAVCRETGVAVATHSWCGHLVHYSTQPTKDAIEKILAKQRRAIVIPVLVAKDEVFQDQIIGKAVEEVGAGDRIAYIPDAILPDPKLEDWVVEATQTTMAGPGSSDSKQREYPR